MPEKYFSKIKKDENKKEVFFSKYTTSILGFCMPGNWQTDFML